MATYAEKLKDPRWKSKRQEILLRDNNTCKICKETDKIMNVHHKYYLSGLEPWEYDDDCYILYCQECHEYEEKGRKQITKELVDNINKSGFLLSDVKYLKEFFDKIRVNPGHESEQVMRTMIKGMFSAYFDYYEMIGRTDSELPEENLDYKFKTIGDLNKSSILFLRGKNITNENYKRLSE